MKLVLKFQYRPYPLCPLHVTVTAVTQNSKIIKNCEMLYLLFYLTTLLNYQFQLFTTSFEHIHGCIQLGYPFRSHSSEYFQFPSYLLRILAKVVLSKRSQQQLTHSRSLTLSKSYSPVYTFFTFPTFSCTTFKILPSTFVTIAV